MTGKSQDPHLEREQAKYENPIPSREFILQHLTQRKSPADRDTLFAELGLNGEEHYVALSRRLRAMEREGQLIFTRNRHYALPQKLNLIRATVIGHRDGFGFARPEDGGDDLFLNQREMLNALHGDTVLLQPLGLDRRGRREARLVRVLEERKAQIVGRYFVEAGAGFVVPDDNRICQDIMIPPEHTQGARQGQMVLCQIIVRPTRREHAVGRIDEVLGDHMAPGMEVEVALRNYDIPHQWPKAVKKQVSKIGETVPEDAKRGRIDLRKLPLVTIDGEDARDFDDAVYCERKRSGGWRLWVAIADVSYYVRPQTALDEEAEARGNSVYFPNQVVPMLPEKLSNGLCSLNPQVDRLCLVAEMTISDAGRLSGYRFYEAVMNSHARLTYNKVAAILDGDAELRSRYAAQVAHLEQLHALYKTLKQARLARGAIEFETLEARFIFNAQRKIEQILPLERNDAHKIIEECMILANVSAARFVTKEKGAALLRVHETPGQEKLENFRRFLGELGLSLSGEDNPGPKDFAALALRVEQRPDHELIQTMLLRSMQQAVYEADNAGHFGLALAEYAHFTSPIRRYPDLLLHRTIKYLLAKQQGNPREKWTPTGGWHYQQSDMDHFGPHCSMTERRADDATRDVDAWLKCEFMQDHVGDEFDGIIAAVTSFGFFVRIDGMFVDGLVHVTSLKNDYYQYDQVHQQLIGENSRRRYRLGDKVSIRVVSVNLDDRQIEFQLAGEQALGDGRRSGKANKAAGKGRRKHAKGSKQPIALDRPAKNGRSAVKGDDAKPAGKPKAKSKAKGKPKSKHKPKGKHKSQKASKSRRK